jgi:hypothetical protein
MFQGVGGFEYPGYVYSNSAHTSVVSEKCVECHYYVRRKTSLVPAYSGHEFTPYGETCLPCHADFDTSAHSFDYRGIQTEITGLLDVLNAELDDATPDDSLTAAFQQARFNRDFVSGDLSRGIHNTAYARDLLTSSIAEFEPTAMRAELTGPDPPIIIPPEGGSLEYTMTFTNNTSATQTVDIWATLLRPDGSTVPVFGPKEKSFAAYSSRSMMRSLTIRKSSPPGEYGLVLAIGTSGSPPIDTDTLGFAKAEATGKESAVWGETAGSYVLCQNHPNPFNATTHVDFRIPEAGPVSLILFDVLGREVAVLFEGITAAGSHSVEIRSEGMAGGIYYCRLTAGPFTDTKKILLLK